jgi:hypothetical protein
MVKSNPLFAKDPALEEQVVVHRSGVSPATNVWYGKVSFIGMLTNTILVKKLRNSAISPGFLLILTKKTRFSITKTY